ncbi:MAG TPA: RHS repeat-associated core domain-containing protein, partial [Ktedonobacterales bacterium]
MAKGQPLDVEIGPTQNECAEKPFACLSHTYDADGNLTQAVDARGAAGTVYAGYDGVDRMLWRNTSNSATNAYVTFSYDSTAGGNAGAGRLTGETFTGGPNNTLAGSASYVYDTRGRQTKSTLTVGGAGYTTWKSYDDAGNVLTQTYPDGEVVTNAYTSGWLTGLSTQQGSTTTTLASAVVYGGAAGAAGDVTGMSLGAGTYGYAASYDLDHRLTGTSLTRVSGNVLLYQSAPTFDGAGNVTAVSTTLPAGTDTQTYCYDEQNRLTWAASQTATGPCGAGNTAGTLTGAAYTQSFAYDTLGRLTSGPLGAYTYGDSAHVHAATAIGSTWTAAYDAAGDMTCRAPTSATTCAGTPTGAQLTYNLEGYPVSWQDAPTSPTTTVGYLYDGQGDCVEQQVTTGGTTTTTVYLGNLEEVSTTGGMTTTTTYYYAGTRRVALAVNGVFSYLGDDELGSAGVALDASGVAQANQLYAPYGAVRYTSGTMPGSFGYAGQRADAATGLDDYVSRYYDPLAGQFTSADTTLPGNGYDVWGLSRYAYVEGNPTTRVDADGHCWPLCTMIIGAVVGAAIAGGMDIATQAAAGTCCDWGQVGKDAAVGALSGAVSGLVGPEAGPLVRAAVDTGVAVGGQVLSNALDHKPLGDGVLLAGAIGLASSVGLGAVMEYGGRYAARALGHAAEDAEADLAHGAQKAVDDAEGGIEGAGCAMSFVPGTPVATPQ